MQDCGCAAAIGRHGAREICRGCESIDGADCARVLERAVRGVVENMCRGVRVVVAVEVWLK